MPASAHAQALLRAERQALDLPVNERVPEDLRAEGMVFRGFAYLSRLDVETRYDSNVLAQQTGERDDYILSLRPAITIKKPYGPHLFLMGIEGRAERFKDRKAENKEEASLFFRGRLEGNSRWAVPFGIVYDRSFRPRTDPSDNSLTVEPTRLRKYGANLGIERRFNRLRLSLIGHYTHVALSDGYAFGSGLPVIFSDSDRHVYGGTLGFRYEIPRTGESRPEHVLFADFNFERQEYDRPGYVEATRDFTGVSNDRTVTGVLAGFETRYKGLLFANLGIGLIREDFDAPGREDQDTLDLQADIAYTLLPKLTLNFGASRFIDQDNGSGQGSVNTFYRIGADYELLHDTYLSADGDYSFFDFHGSNREDESLGTGIALRHYHSRNLESNLEFRFLDRQSTEADLEFDRYTILLRLIGKI